MQAQPQTITFELVLNMVKQLPTIDQFRLLEWIMKQLKQTFSLTSTKPQRQAKFGSGQGTITMAADFDAPLEDFKEYMP